MTKFFFLTSLSLGVHSPRRCPYRALLSDHENKRFVIIVLREEPQQADGRFGKAFQHVVTRVWDKNNPFSWGDDSPAHRVVALEIDWSSIVGIDYRCPLHDDGKLVLEARQVVKRCFKTVEDARDFYSPRSADVRSGPLRMSHSAVPTPNKMSLDGRQAMLASVSCAHMGSHLPISPRLARLISCGPVASTSATGLLRPAASAEVRSAAAAAGVGASAGAGGDWCLVGRGRALGGNLRLGLESGQRSASATRAPRAGAAGAHVGRAAGSQAMATSAARSSCMDYASADEGEGGSRHRRPAPTAVVGLGTRGGAAVADGGLGVAGSSARRRLQLRAAESLAASTRAGAADRGSAAAALDWESATAARQQCPEASPRKAKSTNDLCGMEAAQRRAQRERADASLMTAAAASTAAARLAGTQPVQWSASATTAAGARISAVHRYDAAVSASWDYDSSLASGARSRGGGGGGGGGGAVCSSSVDSLSAAFMSRQHQQMVANELNLQRRRDGRVRREPVSWTQLSDAGQDGLGGGAGGAAGGGSGSQVPRASRWTQPSAAYRSNTVVLSFRDPFLPQELRRFVKSDMRLLKLYESGLPAWAVFMPCYGLPYRPWLRRALWLLFIAISVFSMGCGFYDLYKNVPFLKQVITAVASRMYLPASELFEWLERHTQVRMSILLTYLFSKSPLLVSLMRALRSLAALLQQLLRPAVAALSAAAAPLLGALQVATASVGGGVAAAGAALWGAAQPVVAAATVSGRELAALAAAVLGPPARMLWAVAVLMAQLVRLVAALVGMVLVGPVQLAGSIGGAISWAGAEVAEQLAGAAEATVGAVRWLLTLGRAARRAAPAVKAGARLAAQAAGGGGGGLSGGMAVWHWLGLEVVGAYNAVRLTFLQAFKSARAVLNFCVTVANTAVRHRVSLLLQLRRFITRQKERLPPAVAASVPLPAFVSMPSFSSIPPFDIPLPGPEPDLDLLDAQPEELAAAAAAAPAERHSLYDMDMVLMAASEDDEGDMLAPQPEQLYGSNGNAGVRRDGGGGGGFSEPIPIPLGGGRGGAEAVGTGLRRRRLHHHQPAARGGGSQLYGMYEAPRQRLDAVDEEEMEEAQLHSDRELAVAEPRSGGGGGKVSGAWQLLRDRRRGAGAPGGTLGPGGNPWMSHSGGGLGASSGEEAEAEDADYLYYASAPGCRNAGRGGRGGLFGDGVENGYGIRASLSSPSRRRGRVPEAAPLSRSVPVAAHANGLYPPLGQESASALKQPWQQQQQQLPNQKQQQQQSRRAKRLLARAASSPSETAPVAAAQRDTCNAAGVDGPGGRGDGGSACSDGAATAVIAATAGAVATGAPSAGSGVSLAMHGANADALACSSQLVSRHGAASEANGGPATASSDGSRSAASGSVLVGGAGAAADGMAVGPGGDGARRRGRGGGAGGDNNAYSKRPGAGSTHVSRQPAIKAA
ncbi:hypothetical protein PLESTB_001461200 [Pleodorina starrii]|uniref:Uncharacterized protein n=1 Tax=Pleodorina starrii TaxID=330485 RepID=A0A9W6BWR8_9CHLO|nr:hypothetical protein PLESTM_001679200 [Pleodorina starrii]GLC59200.1 hypothetical protein PLESTB_001461200 [Pleodorina starrii]GLC74762.1 hypothetical protein PLESTF_001553500 [Pleodorina starrii]